jgi:hypothetical protein
MNNQKIKRDQLQHQPVLLGEKIKPHGVKGGV